MAGEITLGDVVKDVTPSYEKIAPYYEAFGRYSSPEMLSGLAVVVGLVWGANSWLKSILKHISPIV